MRSVFLLFSILLFGNFSRGQRIVPSDSNLSVSSEELIGWWGYECEPLVSKDHASRRVVADVRRDGTWGSVDAYFSQSDCLGLPAELKNYRSGQYNVSNSTLIATQLLAGSLLEYSAVLQRDPLNPMVLILSEQRLTRDGRVIVLDKKTETLMRLK